MTEQAKTVEKTKDEKFEEMILAVIEKSLDAARTMVLLGVKGAFKAKKLSDQVDGGETEDKIKTGIVEAEKLAHAGLRAAGNFVKDFLAGFESGAKDPNKKT